MQYLISFLKSPLGFIFNFFATLSVHLGFPECSNKFLCWGCETFCINDGIQDDMLF